MVSPLGALSSALPRGDRSAIRSVVLEILSFDEAPLQELRYLNAARGGGTEVCRLTIERARVRGLPAGLDALIATSDLQGVVARRAGEMVLLGVAVAEALDELAFDDHLPPAGRTGVVLAGDLYSVPGAGKRGGHGDVTPVWQAFAERFAWTVGGAGNHDDVDGAVLLDGAHVLDGDVIDQDGLRIGGVGLICGNPETRGRRDEDEQLGWVDRVLHLGCDLLSFTRGQAARSISLAIRGSAGRSSAAGWGSRCAATFTGHARSPRTQLVRSSTSIPGWSC